MVKGHRVFRLTCPPQIGPRRVNSFQERRTDCKPHANNRLFGVKKGVSGNAVDGGNPCS